MLSLVNSSKHLRMKLYKTLQRIEKSTFHKSLYEDSIALKLTPYILQENCIPISVMKISQKS